MGMNRKALCCFRELIFSAELREIRASLAASEEYEGLTYEEVTAAIAYSVELYRDADEITLYGFGERETTVVRPQKNKVNTEDAYYEKTRCL